MRKEFVTMMVIAMLTLFPVAVLAMSHGDHSGHGSSSTMKHDDHAMHGEKGHGDHDGHDDHQGHGSHSGHDADGMQPVGEQTIAGVKATAKVLVYDAEKAKLTYASHHLMVFFADAKTGAQIAEGTVAVKVEGQGREDKPVALMAMDGGFGTDLRVGPGHYEIEIGTRLADGEKRKFEFMWMVE